MRPTFRSSCRCPHAKWLSSNTRRYLAACFSKVFDYYIHIYVYKYILYIYIYSIYISKIDKNSFGFYYSIYNRIFDFTFCLMCLTCMYIMNHEYYVYQDPSNMNLTFGFLNRMYVPPGSFLRQWEHKGVPPMLWVHDVWMHHNPCEKSWGRILMHAVLYGYVQQCSTMTIKYYSYNLLGLFIYFGSVWMMTNHWNILS